MINKFSTGGEADPVWIGFLWAVVYINPGVGIGVVTWYGGDLFVNEFKNSACAWHMSDVVALCQVSKFFNKCFGPCVVEEPVFLECLVFVDGLAHGQICHCTTVWQECRHGEYRGH